MPSANGYGESGNHDRLIRNEIASRLRAGGEPRHRTREGHAWAVAHSSVSADSKGTGDRGVAGDGPVAGVAEISSDGNITLEESGVPAAAILNADHP